MTWLAKRMHVLRNTVLPWQDPRGWMRRRVRGLLKGPARRIDMRIVDRVGFESMQGGDFAHVIDVGVAEGTDDLYGRFPHAFLDLFEPQPGQRPTLARILEQREGRAHNIALGSRAGTATLHLDGTGSALHEGVATRGGSVEVPVRRLDEVLAVDDIRRPCLLKIDTEGHELDILQGATGILDAIDCVVAEVQFRKPELYRPGQLFQFLGERGFELADVLDSYISDKRFHCADMVFERRGR